MMQAKPKTGCIAIRVDASYTMGTGHVMRCLTLAKKLREAGKVVCFICQDCTGHMIRWIQDEAFAVRVISHAVCNNQREDARESFNVLKALPAVDWLIVDHYGLDKAWELAVKPLVSSLIVIDDLANRAHACDVLIDANAHQNPDCYQPWVPSGCLMLTGTAFALIRGEFLTLRPQYPKVRKIDDRNPFNILVSFGGSDPYGTTEMVLDALQLVSSHVSRVVVVSVVLGMRSALPLSTLRQRYPDFNVIAHTTKMGQLLKKADFVIGAGGTSSWERCCMGLPSCLISIADNQLEVCHQLQAMGVAFYWGHYNTVSSGEVAQKLEGLLSSPKTLEKMALKAFQLIDGRGSSRIVEQLLKHL